MDALLLSVEGFLERNAEISATKLGKDSVRDPGFVFALRGKDGRPPRRVTEETKARVEAWMRAFEEAKRTGAASSPPVPTAEAEAHAARVAAERAAEAAQLALAAAEKARSYAETAARRAEEARTA